ATPPPPHIATLADGGPRVECGEGRGRHFQPVPPPGFRPFFSSPVEAGKRLAAAPAVIYKPDRAMLAVRQALRELRRRRVRSALTTGGIAIGVAALVLLGALSEKMSRLVEGGRDFATGQVTVSGAGTGALSGMTRGGLLTAEQLRALETIDGVAAVAPIVMFPAADAPAALPLTLAPLVFGVDMEALALNRRSPRPRVVGRLPRRPAPPPAPAPPARPRPLPRRTAAIAAPRPAPPPPPPLPVPNPRPGPGAGRGRAGGPRRAVGAPRPLCRPPAG